MNAGSVSQAGGDILAGHPVLAASLAEARKLGCDLYPREATVRFVQLVNRRFPGMQLEGLRPFRCYHVLTGDYRGEKSILRFQWSPEAIQQAGLLPLEAFPAGRKRVRRSDIAALRGAWVTVYKKAGNMVQVCAQVLPDIPREHPLAFFRAVSVRGVSARAILRLVAVDGKLLEPMLCAGTGRSGESQSQGNPEVRS